MSQHTVEKIGGTSMSDYQSVRDNIFIKNPAKLYQRIFVVSAYGGFTDLLLEHKKDGKPGVYALFADSTAKQSWQQQLSFVKATMLEKNATLFKDTTTLYRANDFIEQRFEETLLCLTDLYQLCQHSHFSLEMHLDTVREMLASLGEAHSAFNTAALLKQEGVNACFVDLTGWQSEQHLTLDERITQAFLDIDLNSQLPIVTGYAHSEQGLMKVFDRGYSEMTFSRVAAITQAKEAIIHKEFHLSSADPRLVGTHNAVPIGRTNYDVADQLANLGMEAIHPKAAKGLRQQSIALRIKNTFDPDHLGTLITNDYVSKIPCVEIIAGRQAVYAIEIFNQEISGSIAKFDSEILGVLSRFNADILSKDMNANTITHFLACNLKTVKRVCREFEKLWPDCEITQNKVSIVSAIGSDMKVSGMLAQTVKVLADCEISVLAMHQSMRQVDMQFIVKECDYERAITALHRALIEVKDHGKAICLAC